MESFRLNLGRVMNILSWAGGAFNNIVSTWRIYENTQKKKLERGKIFTPNNRGVQASDVSCLAFSF